jgi:hypothetical protein
MTDINRNVQALRDKKAVVEMGGGEAVITLTAAPCPRGIRAEEYRPAKKHGLPPF